ncbi:TPA: phage virion morphogenesis protein, partial [Klebsiella pneumoniae]|nr:phage virion morphogenesis protein [Klebsiella pneumoniae]
DRVKREMFAKLRISRFMKATAGNDVAVVEFTGKVQRMVNVHQYGLKDKPSPNSGSVEYPARILLGFSPSDIDFASTKIVNYLSE